LGLLLHAIVHPADIQDRDGGILVMANLFGMFPFLKKLFADGGYQGPEFNQALARVLPYLKAEIVKRSDQAKGFVVLPKRWIVERTFAWLNRCRRLAKDWENLNRKRWHSCTSPHSASCSEDFVIPHEVIGQTLSDCETRLAVRSP
jgi:putative transposase